MNDSVAIDAAKGSFPLAVTGLQWFGIPLADWVLILTAIYTLMLIASWVRKFVYSRRLSDRDPVCAEDCPVARRLILERDEARNEDN